MWRAFFMGVGVFVCLLGAECMVTDRFVFASESKPAPISPVFASAATAKKRELVPPEHAPWTLLSIGAVSILYSLTLPKLGGAAPPPQ
jgi:hypothetical protein